jgi:protein tyrosine phosphatase (PTP) superfamily phosphohydrolase (DUF442 family)
VKSHLPTTIVLLILATACATGRAHPEPAPALSADGSAFEAAARVPLAAQAPAEHPGLHHVYRLSDTIVSGAEPEGEEAFRKLAEMGVRTILSVDGKEPDHELAARHGLRYVHVPIRYRGIADGELQSIAKTFRELEGPFYVHCYHGQHRGPAAAAVGRVVLDGAPREQAIAEMRQWCGTSSKYEGLYATIAYGALPSAAETAAHDFDFAPAHRFSGFRHAMVDLARSWDTVEALGARGWTPDPEHPDASARNEAAKTLEIFRQSRGMTDIAEKPADFHEWLAASEREAAGLVDLLDRFAAGDAAAGEEAKAVSGRIKKLCADCHSAYRNER